MTKHAQNKSIKISKDIIEDTDRREYIEIIDKHKTFKTWFSRWGLLMRGTFGFGLFTQ